MQSINLTLPLIPSPQNHIYIMVFKIINFPRKKRGYSRRKHTHTHTQTQIHTENTIIIL